MKQKYSGVDQRAKGSPGEKPEKNIVQASAGGAHQATLVRVVFGVKYEQGWTR